MRGRTALYGRKHLMQLVAIKRLQAKGLSLAEVQRQLIGLTESALSRLARLPAEEEVSAEPASPRPLHSRPSTRRPEAFWKASPAPVPPAGSNEATVNNTEASLTLPLQGVRLGADVTLLVAATRLLDNEDLEALRKAARPLIERLETRRLIRPREEGETQ